MQEFDKDAGNELEYFARGVWISLQAIEICADFASVNFASHTLISSVFVRFLAEETGSNFASGLTATIDDLKAMLATTETGYKGAQKAINTRLDIHADLIKRLCDKTTDIKIKDKGRS